MTKYQPLITQPLDYRDDEIDLRELFLTLWREKWLILVITLLFGVASAAYALLQPDIYTAKVVLAPQAEDSGGNLGRLAGQFGGLASLAGVNLGGGESNRTVIALETLKSNAFLSDFIARHQLAVPLMAVTGWQSATGEPEYNRKMYDAEGSLWKTDEAGKTLAPTDWDMVKAFRDLMNVSSANDTGIVTLTIRHVSPAVASDWATLLVVDINNHMRASEVGKAEARIAFLQGKVKETNIAGMQQVFFQLIESETRTVMLANAQSEYVFETIDPAIAPQEKSEPKRALIVILGIMLGGMAAVFIVFVRAFLKNGATPNNE
ncbi:Wzz/FepE/Etk N-terminal domain-containing protein [Marinobacter salicampi]|uniref:Wzz/FepE/Etk N-terminal domain-containing protein n=1 Tax=Marinobacter salicampi TaxID=435907 RepID=UPI00140778FF|nr:Wzz/FepE/Etk N-terminal domain-containing protein [Marinobacter salicampi]